MSQNQNHPHSQPYSFPDGLSPQDLQAILASLPQNPGGVNQGGYTVSHHSNSTMVRTYHVHREMALRVISSASFPTPSQLQLLRMEICPLQSIRVISSHLHRCRLATHLLRGPAFLQARLARLPTSTQKSTSKCWVPFAGWRNDSTSRPNWSIPSWTLPPPSKYKHLQ